MPDPVPITDHAFETVHHEMLQNGKEVLG